MEQTPELRFIKDDLESTDVGISLGGGVDFLQDWGTFTVDATVTAETRNGRILYKVEGGNSGLLIGKRGQTLEAMQYLAEKIVNKQKTLKFKGMRFDV